MMKQSVYNMYVAYCTDRSSSDDIALLGGNYWFESSLASSQKMVLSVYCEVSFFHSLGIDHILLIIYL